MSWIQGLSLTALIVLIVITIVRMPSVLNEPSSRLAWLAAVSGCAAFSMVGIVIPLELLDGWLGGTNVVHLLQSVLAVTAFWFIMQASRTLDGSRFDVRSVRELSIMLLAFTIPFLLIPDRGTTSGDFIKLHAHEPLVWAYNSIYMACVGLIMIQVLAGIHGRTPRQYVLIRAGCWAIVSASVLEIGYMTLRLADAQPRELVDLLGRGFALPFYVGVIVAAIGLAAFALASRTRTAMLTLLRVLLLQANASRGFDLTTVSEAPNGAYNAYRLAVRLTDIANSERLSWRERAILRVATRMLDHQMRAPAVIRLSGHPPEPTRPLTSSPPFPPERAWRPTSA